MPVLVCRKPAGLEIVRTINTGLAVHSWLGCFTAGAGEPTDFQQLGIGGDVQLDLLGDALKAPAGLQDVHINFTQ